MLYSGPANLKSAFDELSSVDVRTSIKYDVLAVYSQVCVLTQCPKGKTWVMLHWQC